jgi:uncharacterized protein (DUF2267 family)
MCLYRIRRIEASDPQSEEITMPDTQVRALDDSVHTTNEWLKELADMLHVERETAYKALRGYLQTVRDCVGTDEAADLAAQLPLLLRGVFYHGWNPSKGPVRMDRGQFAAAVARSGQLIGPNDPDPFHVIRVTTEFLNRRVARGEMEDVIGRLQRDVRELMTAQE